MDEGSSRRTIDEDEDERERQRDITGGEGGCPKLEISKEQRRGLRKSGKERETEFLLRGGRTDDRFSFSEVFSLSGCEVTWTLLAR